MEKISKKDFIELLCAHESALLSGGTYPIELDNKVNEMFATFTGADSDEPLNWRTVTKCTSSKITFSGGSCLSLNDFGEHSYYKVGSCILQKSKIDYGKDANSSYNNMRYGYVIYLIK